MFSITYVELNSAGGLCISLIVNEGLGSASQPGDSTHYPKYFLHPFQVPTRRD